MHISQSLVEIPLIKILHREHTLRERTLRLRFHQIEPPIIPIDIVAHQHGGEAGRTQAQQIRQETGTRPTPEADLRVDRFGKVLGRSVMTAPERVSVFPATRLADPAVHVEIDMATRLDFALDEGVRVQHVDELGIARVELLVLVDGDEERHRRVKAGDSRELIRTQRVSSKGWHVGAQAEADYVDVRSTVIPQPLDQLCQTVAYMRHVVDSHGVAGRHRQPMPVNGDEIIAALPQILVPHDHEVVQLHIGIVTVHDDLCGRCCHEVRVGQIRRGVVHQQLLSLVWIVLGEQEERHFVVGAGLIGIHQARSHEVILTELIVHRVAHHEGLRVRDHCKLYDQQEDSRQDPPDRWITTVTADGHPASDGSSTLTRSRSSKRP